MFQAMRGRDTQQSTMFSYLSAEQRVPTGHPLRRMRPIVDTALKALSPSFDEMYSAIGRPSIAPEKLLKALLLQALYTIRSERLLVEHLSYNLLFRWFIGQEPRAVAGRRHRGEILPSGAGPGAGSGPALG